MGGSPRCWWLGLLLLLIGVSNALADSWDAPLGYYSSATGTGATLKSQLTSIMSTGHIQRQYGDFRNSAAIHDQDPANPNNILLSYNRASVPATWDAGATWNREHVWPVSRQPGSASNSSRGNLGDPHALRPVNPSINSSRSNDPFGFDTTTGGYGSQGSHWYPGDADKGDIARMLFYSDTRWSSLGLSLTDGFPDGNQMGDLASLVAWNYLDPPDEFERRRNHTIYSQAYNSFSTTRTTGMHLWTAQSSCGRSTWTSKMTPRSHFECGRHDRKADGSTRSGSGPWVGHRRRRTACHAKA